MKPPTPEDFPTLGFVPCPGDHDALTDVVGLVKRTAEALAEIKLVLRGAANGEWRGKAATGFRELLADDFRPKVSTAHESFDLAKKALDDWADYMKSHQKTARDLEREALEAEQAKKKEKEKEKEDGSDKQGSKKGPSEGPGTDGDDPVEAVRKRARTLHSQYEEKGREIAERLKHAGDIAPNEPGMWDKFTDAIGDALKTIAWAVTNPMDALKALAPLLKVIGDIAGFLSPILGLLAMVPGLQILGAVSLALAGVALVTHYLSAAGKSGSFVKALTDQDVILDAAGLAVGVGALKVGAKVMQNAQVGNGVREVPQLLSRVPGLSRVVPATETVPNGLFQFAKGAPHPVSATEMGWRGGQFFTTWSGHVLTSMGTDGLLEAGNKLFTRDTFGPLIDKSAMGEK
ncbi:putative T7SS-secreted protein [Streptomyces huasconensis]|uniref:putative T7SS-secreted protein n=1 Tax=Streptomyces huasconensis TaxID=1854574 RepID=UPI0037028776